MTILPSFIYLQVSSIVFNSPYKEMLVSTDEGYMKLYNYGTFKEQANVAGLYFFTLRSFV